MGSSSRPKDYDKKGFNPEQSINYFVEYIEKWRQAMDITDFYLAGHSWGGYMVGNYACKYHSHIKKLLLLSPVGISSELKMDFNRQVGRRKRPPKCCVSCCIIPCIGCIRPCINHLWHTRRISPWTFLRSSCCPYRQISKFVDRR